MARAKILYAEDESFLGKIVRESLESRGFEVLMIEDGAKVFDAFREFHPDICVLDIMLPNRDGFEIADDIRSADQDVPIIFLTAKTQTEDVVKGFTIGADDYIRKPFSMEELIVRINRLVQDKPGRENGNASEVQLGKYIFRQNRQLLVIGNEERKLSFRESELLRVLYENRENIIDRKNILNALWGNDSFFNSRNLDVYITRLRSYIKDDPRLEILTIKGVGYRFITG